MFKIKHIIFGITFLQIIPIFSEQRDKWIVVTTIQYPTAPLKKFASLKDWQLVVVGDKKTPHDWHLDNCIYLSAQIKKGFRIILLNFCLGIITAEKI